MIILIYYFLPTEFSFFTKRLLVPFTPCCAAMTQTLVTVTLRSEPTLLSSTCPYLPSSWRHYINSTISLVSICSPLAVVAFHLLRMLNLLVKRFGVFYFQYYCTWECFNLFLCRFFACSGPPCLSPRWRCWPRQWQHYQSVCCHGDCRLPFATCQSQPLHITHSGEW